MTKFGIMGIVSALLTSLMLAVGGPMYNQASAAEPEKKDAVPLDVPQYLQDISVTIKAGQYSGSGVLRVTKDGQVWVWTCGHLIEALRETRETDSKKTIVEFGDAKVVKVLTEDGRSVADMNFSAEVIRYSDAENGEDLALLRLRTKKYKPEHSVKFYLDKEIPKIGTKIYHCGSPRGQIGSNSVTNGIVSQIGRVLFKDKIFDQTNAAAAPGSSGGVECLESDGRYIGMLVRGAGETFCFYVPVRRMQTWAKKVGVEFAMDDSLPVPTDEELLKQPVDDSLVGAGSKDTKTPHQHKYMRDYPYKLQPWRDGVPFTEQTPASISLFGININK